MSTRGKGVAGEERVAAYLEGKGYELLARNYRTRAGEIDIVAEKAGTIAFIEVKTWGSLSVADLEFSIDGRKQRRIARVAKHFLARRTELTSLRMRFDVIFIGGDAAQVRHIENAFSGGID